MRRLAALTFVTLDGVMQAPGGPEEDPSGGFTHGGWVAGYWDDFLGEEMGKQMAAPFDLLLGRKTYDIFAAYWPKVKGDDPVAAKFNAAKKYVVSTQQRNLAWENSILITQDVRGKVEELKGSDGPELQVHGSSNLLQTLLRYDLVDELRLKIFPTSLGSGKRLFGDGTIAAGFRLLESRASTKGVIVANYSREGKVKVGSFADARPLD